MAAKNINSLKDDSLSKIFNLLDIDEWIALSQMTKRFRSIVREYVIPAQIITVVGPGVNYSTNELFQMFGKYITKLEFDADDYVCEGRTRHCAGSVFQVFLQMLLDYCEPGKLKEFRIWNINENIQNKLIDQDFLTRTAVYFKNVTSLRISFECDGSADSVLAMERWLASIPDEQINSLHIFFLQAEEYKFKLNPNSFPNVRNVGLSFEPSNNRCLKEVTDFIRGKSNLKAFYCDGLEDEIVKTVANLFPNIKGLGIIDINTNPEEIHLEEFKHLRCVEIKGSMANYQEFHNFFNIIASQKTLKTLKIILESMEDSTIRESILSSLKSNCIREKIYLEQLDIMYHDEDEDENEDSYSDYYDDYDEDEYKNEEMYINYLIVNVFNFKKLFIHHKTTNKIIEEAVANVACLEILVLHTMDLTKNIYQQLMMEKLLINQRLRKSNRLTIYVCNAKKYVRELGSKYDPQIITLKPLSE